MKNILKTVSLLVMFLACVMFAGNINTVNAEGQYRAILSADWQQQVNAAMPDATSKINYINFDLDFVEPAEFTKVSVGEVDNEIFAYLVGGEGVGLTLTFTSSYSKIYAPVDSSYLFSNKTSGLEFVNLKSINFNNVLDTSLTTSFAAMFFNAQSLTELDLTSFVTTNAIDLSSMFSLNTNLTDLNISTFNTQGVENMAYMFNGVSSLKALNLSHLNTSNVTQMQKMFSGMTTIYDLDLTSFNTAGVTNFSGMFEGMTALKTLDISSFVINADSNTADMFGTNANSVKAFNLEVLRTPKYIAPNLGGNQTIELPNQNLNAYDKINKTDVLQTELTSANYQFNDGINYVNNLSELTLSDVTFLPQNFVAEVVKAGYRMGGPTIIPIELNQVVTVNIGEECNVSDVTLYDAYNKFEITVNSLGLHDENARPVTAVIKKLAGQNLFEVWVNDLSDSEYTDVNNFEAGNELYFPKTVKNFFTSVDGEQELANLTELNMLNVNTIYTTDYSYFTKALPAITTLNLTGFDFDYATNLNAMINNNTALTEIIFGANLNTSNVVSMSYMFANLPNLTTITNLDKLDSDSLLSTVGMFYQNTKLSTLTFGDTFKMQNVTDATQMFYGSTGLQLVDLSKISALNLKNVTAMFYDNVSLTTAKLGSMPNVQIFNTMFKNCSKLIAAPSLQTAKATSMEEMFSGALALTSFNLSNTSNVTNMAGMFLNCNSLTVVPTINTESVTVMNNMFMNASKLTSVILTNTSKVQNFSHMFMGASALVTAPNLDFSSATNLSGMFHNCFNLQNVPNYKAENVTDIDNMFYGCNSLSKIDISQIDLSNIETRATPFGVSSGFAEIKLPTSVGAGVYLGGTYYDPNNRAKITEAQASFVTQEIIDQGSWLIMSKTIAVIKTDAIDYLVNGDDANLDSSLKTKVNIVENQPSGLTGARIYHISGTLSGSSVEVVMGDTNPKVMATTFVDTTGSEHFNQIYIYVLDSINNAIYLPINANQLFANVDSIAIDEAVAINATFATDMSEMFLNYGNSDLSFAYGIDTSNATNFSGMFKGSDFTQINLFEFETSNATTFESMFENSKLTSIAFSSQDYLKTTNTSNLTTVKNMFKNSSSLSNLALQEFNTSNISDFSGMLDGVTNLTTLNLSNLNLLNVLDNKLSLTIDNTYKLGILDTPLASNLGSATVTLNREMVRLSGNNKIGFSTLSSENLSEFNSSVQLLAAYKVELPQGVGVTFTDVNDVDIVGDLYSVNNQAVSFKVRVNDTAEVTNLVVKSNGNTLVADDNGVYTITDVESDLVITIEGVTIKYEVLYVDAVGVNVVDLSDKVITLNGYKIGALGSLQFKLVAQDGYQLQNVKVVSNGQTILPNNNIYTITNVNQNLTIVISDAVRVYKINMPKVEGINVDLTDTVVLENGSVEFKINQQNGYDASKMVVLVNGIEVKENSNGYYVIENVAADLNIEIKGVEKQLDISLYIYIAVGIFAAIFLTALIIAMYRRSKKTY